MIRHSKRPIGNLDDQLAHDVVDLGASLVDHGVQIDAFRHEHGDRPRVHMRLEQRRGSLSVKLVIPVDFQADLLLLPVPDRQRASHGVNRQAQSRGSPDALTGDEVDDRTFRGSRGRRRRDPVDVPTHVTGPLVAAIGIFF